MSCNDGELLIIRVQLFVRLDCLIVTQEGKDPDERAAGLCRDADFLTVSRATGLFCA